MTTESSAEPVTMVRLSFTMVRLRTNLRNDLNRYVLNVDEFLYINYLRNIDRQWGLCGRRRSGGGQNEDGPRSAQWLEFIFIQEVRFEIGFLFERRLGNRVDTYCTLVICCRKRLSRIVVANMLYAIVSIKWLDQIHEISIIKWYSKEINLNHMNRNWNDNKIS